MMDEQPCDEPAAPARGAAAAPRRVPVADEAGTRALAVRLARTARPGTVVSLNGPLGAGKTFFVQAFCTAFGIPERAVNSPTFGLIHEYGGQPPLFHFDVYRLRSHDEFLELGAEEYLRGDGICLIEWGARVERLLPPDHLRIDMEPQEAGRRMITLTALGPQSAEWLDALRFTPSAP